MTQGEPPRRTARLVLVDAAGAALGSLAPVEVATPWWQDIGPVVEAVRSRFGVEATILRLLATERPSQPGGLVTYLAQAPGAAPLEPWGGELAEHPLRLPYARPSGPAADLAWVRERLAERGMALSAPPVQIRTWNLSSLWRLPCGETSAWFKAVPPFFAHEGALIDHLAGAAVPTLLARDGARMLMAEIAGEDLYQASRPQLEAMIDLLVALQHGRSGETDTLLSLGLPDWRGASLASAIGDLIERLGPTLAAEDRAVLEAFAGGLPARMAQIAACGVPDTLVHGDFHPGNFRGVDLALTLIDWGDSGVGHPLLDQAAFLDRIPAPVVAGLRARWLAAWRSAVPGCDPERAAALLAPVAAACQAMIYQGFLDRIEPDEHPYHSADPADWLARTSALARAEAP